MIDKIPVYDISIDLNDNETMMSCISLVTDPAVEVDFLAFDKDKKPMSFSITDEDKHCITGVAIRANALIYRYSPMMGEYYVRFTPETIENIVFKYSKMNLWNSVSLEHSGENITDAIMVEYFIKGNGKNPEGFEDVEDGSLFVTYKITNDELWNTIKNSDEINGFSIEIYSDLIPTEEYVEEEVNDEELEMNSWLAELLAWLADEDDYSDKKKVNFKRVTKGDIQDAMNKNRKVNITIGKQTLYEQQIFQISEDVNKTIGVVVYDPQTSDWNTYKLNEIKSIEITEAELENWSFNAKWKEIVNDNTKGIIDTAVGHNVGNTFRDAIETNRLVMISYDDELDSPSTGFRTCLVTSLGYTTGSDGMSRNQAIRIYEYSGDSRTGLEGGTDNWRFMLTRRIKDFKIVDYADPITTPPVGYNGERQQDSGKMGSMSDVELVMKFPPIRTI